MFNTPIILIVFRIHFIILEHKNRKRNYYNCVHCKSKNSLACNPLYCERFYIDFNGQKLHQNQSTNPFNIYYNKKDLPEE